MQNQQPFSKEIDEIVIKVGDLVWCPAYGIGIIYKNESKYFYYIFWSGKNEDCGVSYVSVKDACWFRKLLFNILNG